MASRTHAHPQKRFAGKEGKNKAPNPFTAKKDSPDALFEIMDKEGREHGSFKFWRSKTREEKLEFCKWFVKKKNIQSKTEFSKKAPGSTVDYIRDNRLWDEIGLSNIGIGNKGNRKPKEGSADMPKNQVKTSSKPEKSKKAQPKIASFTRETEMEDGEGSIHDPHSPLAVLPYTPSPFRPIKMTPPLPEPRFRYWESVSKEEKAVMIQEFFEAARKGEIYNFEKLLQMGVPVDVRNIHGETPLMEAAAFRHTKICRMLLDNGADPRLKNKHGENALVYAKDGGRQEIIELIRNAIKKSR